MTNFEIAKEIFSWITFFIKSKCYFNWDYASLLLIEKEKLRRMADYFENKGWAEDSKFQAKRIRLAIRMLDAILDEKYSASLNLRTIQRYVPCKISEAILTLAREGTTPFAAEALKKHKMLYMYNKLKTQYLLAWWD